MHEVYRTTIDRCKRKFGLLWDEDLDERWRNFVLTSGMEGYNSEYQKGMTIKTISDVLNKGIKPCKEFASFRMMLVI